jgi:Zn ribbon nucleic-acid-binding protein
MKLSDKIIEALPITFFIPEASQEDTIKMWKENGIDIEGNKKHLALIKKWIAFEKRMDKHGLERSKLDSQLEKILMDAEKLGFKALPSGGFQ